MFTYVDDGDCLKIKYGRFKKRKVRKINNYLITLFSPKGSKPTSHAFNRHWTFSAINQVWGNIYAIVPNFSSVLDFSEGTEFDFDSFLMELDFVFLIERICIELSLLDEFDIDDVENRCNPCICEQTVLDVLGIKWNENEEGYLYIDYH